MENLQDKNKRLNDYAREKVVARLKQSVKEESARQEALKTFSHAPAIGMRRKE